MVFNGGGEGGLFLSLQYGPPSLLRLTVWRGGVEGPGPATATPVAPCRGERSRAFDICL